MIFPPCDLMNTLTRPVLSARSSTASEPMMAHDRKWGRYSVLWKVRLIPLPRTSFSISARMIGAGNPTRRFRPFSMKVFLRAAQKPGILKISLNTAKPAHFDPKMPLKML